MIKDSVGEWDNLQCGVVEEVLLCSNTKVEILTSKGMLC